VYRWELDGPAQQQFTDLDLAVRASLAAFMDAVVIVDPVQYQRRRDERDDVSMPPGTQSVPARAGSPGLTSRSGSSRPPGAPGAP